MAITRAPRDADGRSRARGAPTFVSLFSGCGGLDLGFVAAGFRCLLAVDNDPEALAVHALNLKSPTEHVDLAAGRPADDSLQRADAFVCGPPCQGFSTIGGRRLADPRNSLLLDVAKLASIYVPKVVLIENVLGARSRLHNHYWVEAQQVLRSAGYRTSTIDLDVHRLGIPQTRRRVVMIGWTTAFEGDLVVPDSPERASLEDVLEGTEGLDNHDPRPLPPGSRSLAIARAIKPGQKLCNVRTSDRCVRTWAIPEVFGDTTAEEREILEALVGLRRRNRRRDWGDADPVSVREVSRLVGRPTAKLIGGLVSRRYVRRLGDMIDLVHTFNGKYRRPSTNGPAPTVDTRFGDHHYFLHPTEHRAFTVREAAKIQSFPDDFLFQGSLKSQFRMVGNAVPPAAAAVVATVLRESVLR